MSIMTTTTTTTVSTMITLSLISLLSMTLYITGVAALDLYEMTNNTTLTGTEFIQATKLVLESFFTEFRLQLGAITMGSFNMTNLFNVSYSNTNDMLGVSNITSIISSGVQAAACNNNNLYVLAGSGAMSVSGNLVFFKLCLSPGVLALQTTYSCTSIGIFNIVSSGTLVNAVYTALICVASTDLGLKLFVTFCIIITSSFVLLLLKSMTTGNILL